MRHPCSVHTSFAPPRAQDRMEERSHASGKAAKRAVLGPPFPRARPPVIFLEPHVRAQEFSGPPRPAGTPLVDRHFEGRLPRTAGEEPGQPGVRRAPLPARSGGRPSRPPPVSEDLGTALPQVPRGG